ncbi:MAG: ABC transporter permease [bacterium]|nr:ABC transporter permease [bacterium]
MAQSTLAQSEILLPVTPNTSALARLRWNVIDTLVLMRRNLTHIFRQPQLLIFSLVQPIIFVLLFAFVFGGAIQTPGSNYINYLLPGIILQTVIFAATQTTTGLTDDLAKGMIDRFRALPMSRSAVLAGRTLSDAARSIITIVIMLLVGTVIGFRAEGGILGAVAGVSMAVLFGYAFTWIAAFIGLLVKTPETAQVAGFIWVMPLTFASSVFVPTQTMPDWLRGFAENQPISVVANTVRALFSGAPVDIVPALLWVVVILAIFIPLSVRQYVRSVN